MRAGPTADDDALDRPIPWHQRLSSQLLFVTAVIMLSLTAIMATVEARMRRAMVSQATAGAALFSDTIRSAVSHAMMEDHRAVAYETMATIGGQPGIDRVRMIDKTGRITFSTRSSEIDTVVAVADEVCAGCHALPAPPSWISAVRRSRLIQEGGHRAVGLITPILNEARCASAGCHRHQGAEQVLGIIDVSVSTAEADDRLAAFRRETFTLVVVGVVALGAFLVSFARRRVVVPVEALVEGTRRVARDDLDVRIPVLSRNELGALAVSFNHMTGSLKRVEGDLKQLNQDLEQKVEARTADLKRAQAALVQSEKLSSLGQLSASIAHEINNPLAGILTFSKLLARQAEEDVPDPERRRLFVKNLGLVQRETERCRAIVRNLLDFARERPLQLREVALERVVSESLQLIGHQLKLQGHQVVSRFEPVPMVHGDFGELRQAVVNIALNAMEAMGQGGRLEVALRRSPDGSMV
jgi:two-component system NtrC family sensor kinase